ncbi:patatin-like phospholipase family protein [Fulvimarina endophytica]|uniref:Patatin-like phospholipase family protein n=1 Tax=Fulvimarina endophytica TaxID=2293836 RepID=A0A371X833_9HYPH|nr:patatin-like phospholipase family protein [Fulvimarina endophytica]RFC65351.1 patatin-like phospholipase family protein [Fulvimarina endophytica]
MTDIGLALGGGGARGIAHIHVLAAFDELGLKPVRIVGSSIGAIVGAGYCAGISAREIGDFMVKSFAHRRDLAVKLWQTRPPSFRQFLDDGGFRIGQLNVERIVASFLPDAVPKTFDSLTIPLGVMATDYYRRLECELDSGEIVSALGASAALPAIFRPVRREGRVLVDGGIYNPLPYDRLKGICDLVVAVDVNGGPEGDPAVVPATVEAMIGSSQLMMQSVIDLKVRTDPPDILVRPRVSPYKVLDFLRAAEILRATEPVKDNVKRALENAIEARRLGVTTRAFVEVIGTSPDAAAHESSAVLR